MVWDGEIDFLEDMDSAEVKSGDPKRNHDIMARALRLAVIKITKEHHWGTQLIGKSEEEVDRIRREFYAKTLVKLIEDATHQYVKEHENDKS